MLVLVGGQSAAGDHRLQAIVEQVHRRLGPRGARYYDPATAQFLTIDPLVSVTKTPYAYVVGNPLNHSDPSGKDCGFWCWAGITVAVVAVSVATAGLADAAMAAGGAGAAAADVAAEGAELDVAAEAEAQAGVEGAAAESEYSGGTCTAPKQPMSELERTGSGLKGDVLHRSASWVVDDSGASQFTTTGGDGVARDLYQLPGEVNGNQGVFESIVDESSDDPVITHQRFIKNGRITGTPNQRP